MPAPTDLAAALLRDVPIRGRIYTGGRINTGGNCLDELVLKKDVLAALSAHLDAATAERAGEADAALRAVGFVVIADLITALLAQNAALRAELDWWKQDARAERLEAALTRIVGIDSHIDATVRSSGPDREVVYGDFARIARAALKGADHE